MREFIKGRDLCRDFFLDCARPILDQYFPELPYSAGLIGYGSDVLGYDDAVSTDHMWGRGFTFEKLPLIGRFSAVSSWSEFTDQPLNYPDIRNFYESALRNKTF